ncbi:MAG TPA: alpha-glucuronidase family glycosyl hydrolase [Actinopolymorphaceae bacterium]
MTDTTTTTGGSGDGRRWTRRRFLTRSAVTTGAALTGGSFPFFVPAWAAPTPEDGYALWLRYPKVGRPDLLSAYRRAITHVVTPPSASPVERSAASELVRGLSGLLGREVSTEPHPRGHGALILGTPESSPLVAEHVAIAELRALGPEGYILRRRTVDGRDTVLVASEGARGVLYGAFGLLRLLQTYERIDHLDVKDRPASPLRFVNHWDNLDRTVERGYAGASIFRWDELPSLDPRYTDYARALASVGINGTVVNNVNANAQFLASERLPGLAALAGVLRDWGVTFHLSANYASPMVLTRNDPNPIDTADPFDPRVQAWWRDKIAEIYEHIPDFGGFLVKANSEGQPGPLDYGRTHAEGANMLAELIEPYGGKIMWRSFVHEGFNDWAEYQYRVFAPLDGEFARNVAVQTKNGPIDFQVREPVNPLFGALPQTNQMIELQITQEYTGHSTHLCYLVPQWKDVLDFDTHAQGPGTTVASIVDGSAYGQTTVGFAGVINFGADRNWTGHHLAAANTHGFARLAWNPRLAAEDIATEWVRMTFGSHPGVVEVLTRMLLSSWETYEAYTSPLGMGYLTYPLGAHFDPDPWSTANQSHFTDAVGTGFDRSVATGTGYTGLYAEPWASRYEHLETCPDELLLFMHKVPYTHVLHSGSTVIQHIYDSHFTGLERVLQFRRWWQALRKHIDPHRHAEVLERLDAQVTHATVWRDTIVSYFFGFSRILDERRVWLQVDLRGASALLFGGWPNRLPVEVGNATPDDLIVRARVVPPDDSWMTSQVEQPVASTEFATLKLPVLPPLVAENVTLDLDFGPEGRTVLGASDRAFVVTPAARRCVLALDAGTPDSPLVRDYTRLTPDSAWDPARGFGWVGTPPQSRDRGGSFDALRRDFVNDIPARTLRIAVPAGQHEVAVLVGDAGPDSHPTYIFVDGERVAESPFLPGGTFTWLRFSVDGGASGREVDLTFDSLPDQHWHLCALVIPDPDSTLPEIVVTDVEASLPWLAGQRSELTVTVVNTTSDTSIPVTVTIDAPDGWVVEPFSATIPAGSEQALQVPLTPPGHPTLATLTVEVRAGNGASVGDDTRRLDVIAVPSGDSVALALDAGGPASPVLSGYRRLSPQDAWSEEAGYGWVDRVPEYRDRAMLDVLRRDLVFGRPPHPTILRVAVPPGAHQVYVLTGDAFATSSETVVSVDGQIVGRSGESTIPQGSFRWFDFTLDGGESGRTVDLELTGNIHEELWRIVALIML